MIYYKVKKKIKECKAKWKFRSKVHTNFWKGWINNYRINSHKWKFSSIGILQRIAKSRKDSRYIWFKTGLEIKIWSNHRNYYKIGPRYWLEVFWLQIFYNKDYWVVWKRSIIFGNFIINLGFVKERQ